MPSGDRRHCQSEVATVLKVPDRFVPTVATAPMMMTATRAAIRPYSMAVTPDSSAIMREKRLLMETSVEFARNCAAGALIHRCAIHFGLGMREFHARMISKW